MKYRTLSLSADLNLWTCQHVESLLIKLRNNTIQKKPSSIHQVSLTTLLLVLSHLFNLLGAKSSHKVFYFLYPLLQKFRNDFSRGTDSEYLIDMYSSFWKLDSQVSSTSALFSRKLGFKSLFRFFEFWVTWNIRL